MKKANQINPVVLDQEKIKMRYIAGELQGLRKVFEYLCDGDHTCAGILIFIKGNYKEWRQILIWLKNNQLYGKRLKEFFQNESPDGGGYHMGVTHILARMKGHKYHEDNIKVDELL